MAPRQGRRILNAPRAGDLPNVEVAELEPRGCGIKVYAPHTDKAFVEHLRDSIGIRFEAISPSVKC